VSKKNDYLKAYDCVGCQRTSNMLDRAMKLQKRRLYNGQHFHGTVFSATNQMRAHALLVNFCPYNPTTTNRNGGIRSPFEKLNGFQYRDDWLENLLVASSLNGFRSKINTVKC